MPVEQKPDHAVEAVGAPTEEETIESIAARLGDDTDEGDSEDQPEPEGDQDETPVDEGDEGTTEGDAEENQGEEGQQPATVLIDGVEVTQDELIRGFRREADYTRKTQAVAEQRRRLDSEQTALTAEREKLAQYLNAAQASLQELVEQPVDWDALRQSDPIEYGVRYADHQRRLQKLAEVQVRQQELNSARQQTVARDMEARVAEETDKLLRAIPSWKDPERRATELTELYRYGATQGFSKQDLDNVVDHRAFILLHKAMKFDKAMKLKQNPGAAKHATTAKPATAVAPGPAGKGKSPKPEQTKLFERARKSGSIDDAALLIESILGD